MSWTADPEFRAFLSLINAAKSWLDEMVIVGGWAHRLHQLHPDARPSAHEPLRTEDLDIALRRELRSASPNLAQTLSSAGFIPAFSGDDRPPVTHYQLKGGPPGFELEFIAPQVGSGRTRDGAAQDTVELAGVSAQVLRHVEVLLAEPWTVSLPAPASERIRVVNPAAFVFQKLLVHRPHLNDRAKDALYIFDTFELFSKLGQRPDPPSANIISATSNAALRQLLP